MGISDNMERVLSLRLRSVEGDARLRLAREVVEQLGDRFDAAVCAVLAEGIEGVDPEVQRAWLGTLPETPNSARLRTMLLSDPVELASAWERFFSFRVERAPFDLLAWSRALAAIGAHDEAIQKFRLATTHEVGHTFFARAEKLVSELDGFGHSNVRQFKLAILGSSTTSFLVPILRAMCLRDRVAAEIYEAPYGSIQQEIWDENSGLHRFRPNIVLSVSHWRDLNLDGVTADGQHWVGDFVEQRKTDWKRLSDSFACHIIQPAFDYPATDAYGRLASSLAGGRTQVIDLLNLRLRQEAPPNVAVLDLAAVQRDVGASRWQDDLAWARYRQHPTMEALPDLAEAQMALIRAVLGLSRKVLVTDLDHTLWGGVIGEDGLDGIKIGPDSPEGEAHLRLQQYMLDLKRRGILLAVCSKNNSTDARSPFLEHPHMALKLDDFAAFRANWEDKVTNLRAIAQDLSLGLDSFVFVDDNPLECEWVRSQLPEVAVVELGSTPFHCLRRLNRARYFEALTLSAEDLDRADQYRVEAQRNSLRSTSASLEEFLQKLQMEAAAEEVTPRNIARVTQLINKTNQFNVVTRRYTEAQVRNLAEDPQGWIRAFRMSDRMGSYGLIGVLCCRPEGRGAWQVDTWLMSCRTLGREMEKFMFDRMVEAATERGIARIEGVYKPTAKNGLVKDLFDRVGFERAGEGSAEGGEVRYVLQVPATPVVSAKHIRNLSESTPTSRPKTACVS